MRQIIAILFFLRALAIPEPVPIKPTRKRCIGYIKIEYGKAVDCHGDTIKIREFNERYKEYERLNK